MADCISLTNWLQCFCVGKNSSCSVKFVLFNIAVCSDLATKIVENCGTIIFVARSLQTAVPKSHNFIQEVEAIINYTKLELVISF